MARNELTHLASLAALNRAVEALFSIGKAARLFFSGFSRTTTHPTKQAPHARFQISLKRSSRSETAPRSWAQLSERWGYLIWSKSMLTGVVRSISRRERTISASASCLFSGPENPVSLHETSAREVHLDLGQIGATGCTPWFAYPRRTRKKRLYAQKGR
jgi:hypothetical protein